MTLSFPTPPVHVVAAPPASLANSPGAIIRVREEYPFDVAAREALLDDAFGPFRAEKTSARLREGREPAQGLALVALAEGELVGTLRCWPVRAGGRDALLLGPLAVAKSDRSRGIGAWLMREALRRAAIHGHKAVLLVGDAPYYGRFGFQASLTTKLALPGPVDRARFLAFEIEDGALDGAEGMVVATGERSAPRRRSPVALRRAA
jgi:predicted N-acetyltransferase YhbS